MLKKYLVYRGEEIIGDDDKYLSRDFVILAVDPSNNSRVAEMIFEWNGKRIASFHKFGMPEINRGPYTYSEIIDFCSALNVFGVSSKESIDKLFFSIEPYNFNYIDDPYYIDVVTRINDSANRRSYVRDFFGKMFR